jgi:hypothetical protein
MYPSRQHYLVPLILSLRHRNKWMHGYLTPEGEYYETPEGPIHPSDSAVPLRPSSTYAFDPLNNTWRSTHGNVEHNYPRATPTEESISVALTEKKLFSVRDTLYILGIFISAVTVYFGIVAKLEMAAIDLANLKTIVLEHQANSTKEIRECQLKIHELELENAKALAK